MANSVHLDRQGPDWPLGNIVVTVPGTPVAITSLVDSAGVNNPNSPTPGTSGADEYTVNAQQILFSGFKADAVKKLVPNAGNVYVVRAATAGAGGLHDVGTIVATIGPGQTFSLGSSALTKNVYNLYRYFIDADNANDACQVTAIIQ